MVVAIVPRFRFIPYASASLWISVITFAGVKFLVATLGGSILQRGERYITLLLLALFAGGYASFTPPSAAGGETTQPNNAEETKTCEGLVEAALEELKTTDLSTLEKTCSDESCYAVSDLNRNKAAIDKAKLVNKITDEAKKKKTEETLAGIESAAKNLAEYSAGPTKVSVLANKILNAKRACEHLLETLTTRAQVIAESGGVLQEQARIQVCRDKINRLPDFVSRYYGLTQGRKRYLRILRARFGDLYNEDLEGGGALESYGSKSFGRDERRMAWMVDHTVPRSGRTFKDPEDILDPYVDWDRHRHTCDITQKMREKCAAALSPDGQTCIVDVSGDTGGAAMCGYDPSPQGYQQFHVLLQCDGRKQAANAPGPRADERHIRLPGTTKKVPLACGQPDPDLAALKVYFEREPCAVRLVSPEITQSPAPAPPAQQGTADKPKAKQESEEAEKGQRP